MNNLNSVVEKGKYTTTVPADILQGGLSFSSNMYPKFENTSSASISYFWRVKYPHPPLPTYHETYRENFIGILEPGEADRIKKELALYKKKFNDDFARKHKILFGE